MFLNHTRFTLRYFRKNFTWSFLNITGLAAGISVALLIGLWVWDEVSFNSYFRKDDRVAQVMLNQDEDGEVYTGPTIAMPTADELRTKHGSHFKQLSLASGNGDHLLSFGEKKLYRAGMWVQHEFPDMFTIKIIEGDGSALKDPSSMMISASTAAAIFGNTNAINKTIRVDNSLDLKIAAVFEDFPQNSFLYNTNLLLPWENRGNWMWTSAMNNWSNHCGQLFVELNEGYDLAEVNEKIKSVPTPHIERWKEEIMLQPLNKQHLYNEFKNGKATGGRIEIVRLIGAIGIFVLLLACINFMNLSTARSEKRARQVGIRKAVGSTRKQLIWQFLGESVLMTFIAFLLALLITNFSLPFFSSLAGKKINIEWNNPWFWLLTLGFTFLTGIISGSYPAFYLSAFQPLKVLKGLFKTGPNARLPRKVLVVVQFTVSIALIIGTAVIFMQLQHSKNRPVGYSRDGLIALSLTPQLDSKFEVFKNDLLQSGVVANMAASSHPTSHFSNSNSVEWRGKDPESVVFFRDVNVTPEFGETIRWKIREGRDFSGKLATDSAAAIINETAAKIMGFKDPVGEIVKFSGKDYMIIGVTDDMLTQSPYEPMYPTIFFGSGWKSVVTIRIKPEVPTNDALTKIGNVFTKYNPGQPFAYRFIDDEYAKKYSSEERTGRLAAFFAILAVFISCLGLFGLASFIAEQRTREIGIRKVLGASVFNVWKLLSREFVLLVLISIVVAVPIGYLYMHSWLENYEYRVHMPWWIFVAVGALALFIAISTVSVQALRAAFSNPSKSLKTE